MIIKFSPQILLKSPSHCKNQHSETDHPHFQCSPGFYISNTVLFFCHFFSSASALHTQWTLPPEPPCRTIPSLLHLLQNSSFSQLSPTAVPGSLAQAGQKAKFKIRLNLKSKQNKELSIPILLFAQPGCSAHKPRMLPPDNCIYWVCVSWWGQLR